MSVAISAMTADDLDAALELWARIEGVGLHESDGADRLRDYLDRNPGLSLVARDGPRLVGAVLSGHDGRRGCLYHLAIVPEHRGKGLGRKLVERCLESLAAVGILKCNTFLYADNQSGEQFWHRLGWTARGDLKILQRETGEL